MNPVPKVGTKARQLTEVLGGSWLIAHNRLYEHSLTSNQQVFTGKKTYLAEFHKNTAAEVEQSHQSSLNIHCTVVYKT